MSSALDSVRRFIRRSWRIALGVGIVSLGTTVAFDAASAPAFGAGLALASAGATIIAAGTAMRQAATGPAPAPPITFTASPSELRYRTEVHVSRAVDETSRYRLIHIDVDDRLTLQTCTTDPGEVATALRDWADQIDTAAEELDG